MSNHPQSVCDVYIIDAATDNVKLISLKADINISMVICDMMLDLLHGGLVLGTRASLRWHDDHFIYTRDLHESQVHVTTDALYAMMAAVPVEL